MALIDDRTREYLQEKFETELERPVKVEIFKGEANPETVDFSIRLMEELSSLSDKLSFEVKDLDDDAKALGVEASPTLIIGRDLGYRIEYWGAPLGMEAETFIDSLVLASTGRSGLGDMSEALLDLLDKEARVYVFVTPTCPHCPRSALQNNRLAVAAPGKIRSITVEAQENLEMARKYRVSSVPHQLFNEDQGTTTVGTQPEAQYVRSLLEYLGVDKGKIESVEAELKKAMLDLPENPSKPIIVTDDTFDEAIKRYPFLVVDCWAEWCGPCRMVAPVVKALAEEMQGKVVFAKLDTEANQRVPMEYAIHSIPTLLVFRNGKLAERLVGFRPKPRLKQELEKLMPAVN